MRSTTRADTGDQVSGVVMIETPAGQATMSASDVKDLAWNAPGNSEHVEYVAVEHQMAVARGCRSARFR